MWEAPRPALQYTAGGADRAHARSMVCPPDDCATAASRHGRKGVYCLLRAGDSDIARCSVGVPVSMHPVPRCGCGVDGHALSFFSQTIIQ